MIDSSSRSDGVNIAVGFNPRVEVVIHPRRVATVESVRATGSTVATRRGDLSFTRPWVETKVKSRYAAGMQGE
jgi:hypothetical protein